MPYRALMRYYQPFPAAVPQVGPGYPHVTHPSATKLPQDSFDASISIVSAVAPFDLHVLGTPPAFILSQDRTLDLLRLLDLVFSNRLLSRMRGV